MKTHVSTRRLPVVMYRHAGSGFRLAIPYSMMKWPKGRAYCPITIGNVTLTLHHKIRAICGDVPASWLVDLNAPAACVDESEPCAD